jgi:hypothetical protein
MPRRRSQRPRPTSPQARCPNGHHDGTSIPRVRRPDDDRNDLARVPPHQGRDAPTVVTTAPPSHGRDAPTTIATTSSHLTTGAMPQQSVATVPPHGCDAPTTIAMTSPHLTTGVMPQQSSRWHLHPTGATPRRRSQRSRPTSPRARCPNDDRNDLVPPHQGRDAPTVITMAPPSHGHDAPTTIAMTSSHFTTGAMPQRSVATVPPHGHDAPTAST